jgi:Flp pilus assembly protein TadG
MRRILKRLQLKKLLVDDTGATTAVFAIVVLIGIMSGTLALVVDSGQLFLERRVVQNVADASTLYIAQNCAMGNNCASNNPIAYAQNNSPDLNTEITEICGKSPLPGCTPLEIARRDCLTEPAVNSNFVRVRSQTLTVDGGSALLPAFAGLFGDGNSADGSWTLRGCSQAIWGAPSRVTVTLPIAISICSVVLPTSSSTGTSNLIKSFSPANEACTSKTDLNGTVITGNKTGLAPLVLADMDATCTTGVKLSTGDLIDYAIPSRVTNLCSGIVAKLDSLILSSAAPSYVPVFNESEVQNGDRKFEVLSFVRLKITGFSYGGATKGTTSAKAALARCTDLCIVGQFLKGVPPTGNISDNSNDPSLGVFAVKLIP